MSSFCNFTGPPTAYADPDPTLAIMVMMTCSFMENGPGFKDIPNIFTLGMKRAHSRMIGNEMSWATIYVEMSLCFQESSNNHSLR